VVAGSGIDLLPLLDRVEREQAFSEIRGLASSTAEGHRGRFVRGWCGASPVIVQCGRLHVYEGLPIKAVTATVDALASDGVCTILFTNAAGGLRPGMRPGDLLAVERVRPMPYRGWRDAPDSIEPVFTVPGCRHTGDYMWVHGPCYETRAEIVALQRLDGAAVGMSTAPELARAYALGIRTAVVSCITNNCCEQGPLTHADVLDAAQHASAAIADLIRNALPMLAQA
jgi:purine-nucleoside phosphorylase